MPKITYYQPDEERLERNSMPSYSVWFNKQYCIDDTDAKSDEVEVYTDDDIGSPEFIDLDGFVVTRVCLDGLCKQSDMNVVGEDDGFCVFDRNAIDKKRLTDYILSETRGWEQDEVVNEIDGVRALFDGLSVGNDDDPYAVVYWN